MSSESSSRLRQFGLYKTIDSRTAEFLKLSRRRQIRRGCACAAVSSAITVTVVVGALLVYEFGFRSDSKGTPNTNGPSNWLNSVDSSALFDHKSPIETNGKLLAIILKSLDQNQYLKSAVDEHSSHKPSTDSTDYHFEKNIFAKSRKASIGYKYPCVPQSRRNGSREKSRKIKDYHRVMTYLNSLSLRKNGDETPHVDKYSTQQSSPVDNYDVFNQDYQAPTIETEPVGVISPKPDTAPTPKRCCTCSKRNNLSEVLEKLYKSIEQLRPLIVEPVESTPNKDQFNNQRMTTTVKDEQSKYSTSAQDNKSIQKTKHTTTSMIPPLTTTFEYATVNIARNYDKNEYKDYYIEHVETTTNLPNLHSTMANTNQKSSNIKKLSYWKNDLYDTVQDDADKVYVHTETTAQNIRKENNPVTTQQYVQYNFDDKVYTLMPVPFQDTSLEKKTKLFEDYKELVNYLGSLNKIKNLDVNKLQILDMIKEGPVKQSDYEQMFNHKEPDSLHLASTLYHITEKLQTQQQFELLEKPPQKFKVTTNLNTFNKLSSVENNETPKSTLERIPNKADQNLPPAPIVESFLASKIESGTILNLDEATTMSTKPQTDSSEDLPFNLRFYENSEESSILKTKTNSKIAPAKAAPSHIVNGNEHDISLEAHATTSTKEAQLKNKNKEKNAILMIYEYGLPTESSTVHSTYSNGSNGTADSPVAYRLDRSFLGFDQDYYERMPLLVNAMQENHHVDPLLETVPTKKVRVLNNTQTNKDKPTSIRRTSPRPFIFELRSPSPTPFSKTLGSKTWVENYRNAQRLENLQQVIQYLEKTINAKFGDLYELPSSSSTHIAFSGVYVKPSADTNKETKPTSPTLDLLLQSSSNKQETRINHVPDPLFSFKPDNPGDVNLLADGFLRFAPTPSLVKEKPIVPMFRPISKRKKPDNDDKNVVDAQASEIKNIETSTVDVPNSFSVMLNYVPTKTTIDYSSGDGTSSAINKVYFTTSRPVRFQLKRKISGPIRRMYMPRNLKKPSQATNRPGIPPYMSRKSSANKDATMIVHVNLYPQRTLVKELDSAMEKKQEHTTTEITTTTQVTTGKPLMQAPELSFEDVEDYHVGSSGVISIEHRTVPTSLPATPSMPIFETTVSSTSETYSWPTKPPDVVKFSPEDAKVPDHYQSFREMGRSYYTTEANNRKFSFENDKFQDHVQTHLGYNTNPIGLDVINFEADDTDIENHYGRYGDKERSNSRPTNIDSRAFINKYTNMLDSAQSFSEISSNKPTEMNRRNFKDSLDIKEAAELSTLVVKLQNDVNAQEIMSEIIEDEDSDETTTVQTYVPQINGHYRSLNQNSNEKNDYVEDDNENERKKRLLTIVTGLKKPMYVEIKRNNTNINKNGDEGDE